MNKNYSMIRGAVSEARCKNKSKWGSPLYCECGCQAPIDSDPDINLTGVTVSRQGTEGYANFVLQRNGVDCGSINTQYNALFLDGNEYLGVDNNFIADLLVSALSIPTRQNSDTGDTIEETAARVALSDKIELDEQDERNKHNVGYCTKCHTYCYGDCESN
jgi:hypothetical protein